MEIMPESSAKGVLTFHNLSSLALESVLCLSFGSFLFLLFCPVKI